MNITRSLGVPLAVLLVGSTVVGSGAFASASGAASSGHAAGRLAAATTTAAATTAATTAATAPAASATHAVPTATVTRAPSATRTAAPSATATHAPTVAPITATLSLTPTTTNRGGVFNVAGTGFAPNETVNITFSGTTSVTATAKAGSRGVLPATGLSIPYTVKAGSYTVTATGATSKRAATATVTVQELTPSISLSPTTASPGNTITVTGRGFGRQEQVTLALNGAAVTTQPVAITTTNSAFTARVTLPTSLLQGINTISAVGNQSRVSAVTNLTGVLPRSAEYYFAGALYSATDRSTVALLNPNGQPASVTLTFYSQSGAVVTRNETVGANSQASIPVASLSLPLGTFGLQVVADRQISAQVDINRTGRDGDALLGNTGLSTRSYLAEGYTGLTFRESVSVLNPDPNVAAHVQLRLLPFGGRPARSVVVTVPAHTNTVTDINNALPGQSISIIATSDHPVAVERTLTFGPGGYGLTTRAGTNTPATQWIFAEGTTVNRFETFLTVLNPNNSPALVTASFFGASGGSLGSRTLLVAPHSRANIKENDFLNASGIASVVTSDLPVVVERPEYFGSPNNAGIPGSDVFGRNGAGVRWSFPGGNTEGNSEFLLLYNPSAVTVPVDATFYGPKGETVTKRVYVTPTARYTLNVNTLIPGFAPIHGAVLRSASGQGFVTEQTVFAPTHTTLRSTEGLAQ